MARRSGSATRRRVVGLCVFTLALATTLTTFAVTEWKSGIVYDEPKVVTPGENGAPPSDAVVLFDGKDMSAFVDAEPWKVADGVVTAGGHDILSKQAFGDCQLHLEFCEPAQVFGSGQFRGNSGIFLMGAYELQVLDSYNNKTYFDGQCSSIYKQQPPLVNACRKPGEWQTYDVIFTAPKFKPDGSLETPAYITVLQNNVLTLNHYEIKGGTFWHKPPSYTAHADKMPLMLQAHKDMTGMRSIPVKYRNIWIREL